MPKPETLRADLLKFGDVILSSGHAAKDIVVVLGTREGSSKRRYSHAALVLTPTVWLESTGEGTGLTYQQIVTSSVGGKQRTFVDVSHYREIDVFRMPGFDGSTIDPTSDAFQTLLQEFVGFQYPRLCELADTTKWLKQLPETKRRIMDAFNPDDVVNPGAFCSQLVVDLLDKCKSAGWITESVLKEDRPSRTISPNDLADERYSRLVKMDGFVERAALPEPRTYPSGENYDDAINAISRAGTAISKNLTGTKMITKMTENVNDLLNAQSAEFATAAEAMRKGMGLRLLVSEDDPDIEDVPGRPDLLRQQKGALKLGVNPAWQRLEGLATLFQHRIEQCSEAIRTCPQTLTNFMVGLSQIPRSKRSLVIRQNTKWLANMVSILEICRMPLKFLTDVQSDFMRGFSTDGIWIDFIKKTATSYANIAAAFVDFLVAFENEWNKLEHLPLWSRHVAKAHAKQMQKLKAVVNDTTESVRLFVNAVENFSAPKAKKIAS